LHLAAAKAAASRSQMTAVSSMMIQVAVVAAALVAVNAAMPSMNVPSAAKMIAVT